RRPSRALESRQPCACAKRVVACICAPRVVSAIRALLQRPLQRHEIVRWLGLPAHLRAGHRMIEREPPRVQRLAPHRRQAGNVARAAVCGIADDRMADRGEVDADLVRAAGLQRALDERRDRVALAWRDMRARRAAALDDGHRRARHRMAADRRIDGDRALDVAPCDREVVAMHVARGERARQRGLRLRRARDDEEAARVLVEAVHDAGARDAGERRRVVQQRVLQRAAAVARARVDDETGRLVDDDDRVVLVHDRERDRLAGVRRVGLDGRRGDAQPLAAGEAMTRRAHGAVDGDVAGGDPALDAVARMLRQQACECQVESQARHFRRHDDVVGGGLRRGFAHGRRRIIRGCHVVRSMPPMTAALFLNRLRGFAIVALCALLAGGCSLLPDMGKDETTGWSAERLYKEAHEALTDGNFTRAASLFDKIEGRFPYGRFAQQAILEGAYANYRLGEAETATAACDRFIRTYPNHPNVDYALYLKGLVYFREDQGILGYVYELDPAERDPKAMRDSYAAFKELVARF